MYALTQRAASWFFSTNPQTARSEEMIETNPADAFWNQNFSDVSRVNLTKFIDALYRYSGADGELPSSERQPSLMYQSITLLFLSLHEKTDETDEIVTKESWRRICSLFGAPERDSTQYLELLNTFWQNNCAYFHGILPKKDDPYVNELAKNDSSIQVNSFFVSYCLRANMFTVVYLIKPTLYGKFSQATQKIEVARMSLGFWVRKIYLTPRGNGQFECADMLPATMSEIISALRKNEELGEPIKGPYFAFGEREKDFIHKQLEESGI